jgi:hypothetical protein
VVTAEDADGAGLDDGTPALGPHAVSASASMTASVRARRRAAGASDIADERTLRPFLSWGADMAKTRAERARGRGETPSKRALRGAQQTARLDPERGVTSRARKRIQGKETVPDPRYGGRPGQEKSKWRPPADRMSPRQKRRAR